MYYTTTDQAGVSSSQLFSRTTNKETGSGATELYIPEGPAGRVGGTVVLAIEANPLSDPVLYTGEVFCTRQKPLVTKLVADGQVG